MRGARMGRILMGIVLLLVIVSFLIGTLPAGAIR